jgi:hypothetical protein
MAIFVLNFLPDGLMQVLPVLTVLPTCLAALYFVPPAKPSRSPVVVLEMRALGSKMPDVDLRNPDTLACSFFGARERQALAEAHMPTFIDRDFADAWNNLGGPFDTGEGRLRPHPKRARPHTLFRYFRLRTSRLPLVQRQEWILNLSWVRISNVEATCPDTKREGSSSRASPRGGLLHRMFDANS